MISVKFLGGLGNQMFQYAMLLRLKEHYPYAKIRCDLDSYKYVRFHTGFILTRLFNIIIDADVKKRYTFLEQKWYKFRVNVKKHLMRIGLPMTKDINGDVLYLNRDIETINTRKYTFVHGTWESPFYFESMSDKLKQAFTFPQLKDRKNFELSEIITTCKSVSIHVRRGDYVNTVFSSPAENGFYDKALDYLVGIIGHDIKLFVFSDDVDWCRNNMHILQEFECTFVDWNTGFNSYIDMQLMALCKYNIIANSTFSWWSAFLNDNEDKVVIAPREYYKDKDFNEKFVAIHYPNEWILL